MTEEWKVLGLENTIIQKGTIDIAFIKTNAKFAGTLRRLLGYMGCNCHDQPPLEVKGLNILDDGIRIDQEGTTLYFPWDNILAHGSLKLNGFIKQAIESIRGLNERTKPVLMWKEEDGIHTLDGEVFLDPIDALEHAVALIGRELTEHERFAMFEAMRHRKKGSPGTPSKEVDGPASSVTRPNGTVVEIDEFVKELAIDFAPWQNKILEKYLERMGSTPHFRTCQFQPGNKQCWSENKCDSCPVPEEKRGSPGAPSPEKKNAGPSKAAKTENNQGKKRAAPAAPRHDEKKQEPCDACKDKGYLFIEAEHDTHTINEVQRCDLCETIEDDHLALIAAINDDWPKVAMHLEVIKPLECNGMPLFFNGTNNGNCERLPRECLSCYAEYVEKHQVSKVGALETTEEGIDEKGMEDALSPKEKCLGSLPNWTCRCDVNSRHPGSDYRCARCGTINPAKGDVLDAAPTENDQYNLLDTVVGKNIINSTNGYATPEDEEGIEDMVHGRPEDQVLTITAAEEAIKNGVKISPEAMEELREKIKEGKIWLPPQISTKGKIFPKPLSEDEYREIIKDIKPLKIKPEDLKVDRKLARMVTGVETSPKFWDCECKEDQIKPKAMVRCIKCKAIQENCPDSKVRELMDLQLLIAKEEKIDFSSWTDDDMEFLLVEVAMGLQQPFNNSILMSEMTKMGMALDKAMELSHGAWQTEGHFTGNDTSRLFVTLVEWENYDIPEVKAKVTVKPCLDCKRPIDPERRNGRCEQCDGLFKKEQNEKKPHTGICGDCKKEFKTDQNQENEIDCIIENSRCRACQKKWALSPAPEEAPKKTARASGAKKKATVADLKKED